MANPGDVPDEDLMLRTKSGDKDAFVELIHRYQQPLVNFFRRIGANTSETEDLAQETFLRLYAYRERYEPKGRLRNMLYVMARHAWLDAARKNSRRPLANSEIIDAAAAPEATAAGGHHDIQNALEALSEKLRTAVVLSVCEGLKYEEIAEILDVPIGTVKSRIHLAFKQLREILNVKTLANK